MFTLPHAHKLLQQKKDTVFVSPAKETWVLCLTFFYLIIFVKIAFLFHNYAITILMLLLLNLML